MIDENRVSIEIRVIAERLNLSQDDFKKMHDAYRLIQTAIDNLSNYVFQDNTSGKTAFAQFSDYTASAYQILATYNAQYLQAFKSYPEESRLQEILADVKKLGVSVEQFIYAVSTDDDIIRPALKTHKSGIVAFKLEDNPLIVDDTLINISIQRTAVIVYNCYDQLVTRAENISQIAISPKQYVIPNHKLANTLTKAKSIDDPLTIIARVSPDKPKIKPVEVTCVLSYEGDDIKLSGRQPFTDYDRSVYNAISSLYAAGNRQFTAAMVWRVMSGKKEQEKPTAGQLAAVTKSIDKMRFIHAKIDYSAEAIMRKMTTPDGEPVTEAEYDSTLLHADGVKLASSKGLVKGYVLLAAPVLYEHSCRTKQLISAPIELLDIKKIKDGVIQVCSIAYTEQRIAIKTELLRRIEGMKGDNKLNNRCIRFTDYTRNGITHRGLYSIAGKPELCRPAEGLTDAEAQKRKKAAYSVREDCKQILEYWAAIRYIKGFKLYKEQKAIAGYEIFL